MTRPTARVLALLEILQAGGGFTVADLAGRLGVDERTVRRYAVHLADLGIPVEVRRGRYGGYQLAAGYKLPPLMLTDEEAVAVTLGLVAGRRTGLLTAEGAAAESASAKIRRVLPAVLARRIDSLLSAVDFAAPAREPAPPGVEVLLVLADAARHQQRVRFTYTTWRGQSSERQLDPYGLVFHAGRWYVTGHDHSRRSVRTFRLDRISTAWPGEGSFDIPTGFDPTTQVLAGLAAVPYAHDISVVLHTSLAQAQRRIPRSVGTLTEVPDGVRLTTRAERLDGAAQLLAGIGWSFTIERPDTLREEVRALAARLLTDAGGGRSVADPSAPATFERVPLDLDAYVQRARSGRCFVCALLAGDPDDHHEVVFDDGEHIAFLSKYPTLYGYVLVSPRRHVEHIVRDLSAEEYLRLQAVIYRVARAVEAVVPSERTYVLSLGSQQGNSHVHWHIAPLPPGTPYERQQYHALMADNGVIAWSGEQAEHLAALLRHALALPDALDGSGNPLEGSSATALRSRRPA